MPPPLQVVFELKNLKAVADAANKAADAFDRLGKSAQNANQSYGAPGGGSGTGTGTTRSIGAGTTRRRRSAASAAYQKTSRARANRAINQALGQSFSSKLLNVLKSSRFGAGGLMPLVGQTAKAFGAGPLLIVAAAGLVVKAFKEMVTAAEEATATLTTLSYSTGSRGASLGALSGLSSALGGPAGVSSLSSSLQSRITSDPFAMATAAQMGVFNLPRPFGQIDEGKNLKTIIDRIRELPFEGRVRTSRLLGIEGAEQALNLSKSQYEQSQNRGKLQERIFGDKETQEAVADFTQSLNDLGDSFKRVLGSLGKPFLKALTAFFNTLADILDKISELQDWLSKIGVSVPGTEGTGTSADAHTDALNANTRTMAENNVHLDRLNATIQGTYGRGERTERALRGALGVGAGPQFLNNTDRAALRLGPI